MAAMMMFACGSLVGCGSPVAPVTGKVTLDGDPVEGAIVAFSPDGGTGTSGAAKTGADGTYELVSSLGGGVPPGKYKIAITTQKPAEQPADAAESEEDAEYNGGSASEGYDQMAEGENDDYADKWKETIPAKYNTESTLMEEVTSGENTINFELESK